MSNMIFICTMQSWKALAVCLFATQIASSAGMYSYYQGGGRQFPPQPMMRSYSQQYQPYGFPPAAYQGQYPPVFSPMNYQPFPQKTRPQPGPASMFGAPAPSSKQRTFPSRIGPVIAGRSMNYPPFLGPPSFQGQRFRQSGQIEPQLAKFSSPGGGAQTPGTVGVRVKDINEGTFSMDTMDYIDPPKGNSKTTIPTPSNPTLVPSINGNGPLSTYTQIGNGPKIQGVESITGDGDFNMAELGKYIEANRAGNNRPGIRIQKGNGMGPQFQNVGAIRPGGGIFMGPPGVGNNPQLQDIGVIENKGRINL